MAQEAGPIPRARTFADLSRLGAAARSSDDGVEPQPDPLVHIWAGLTKEFQLRPAGGLGGSLRHHALRHGRADRQPVGAFQPGADRSPRRWRCGRRCSMLCGRRRPAYCWPPARRGVGGRGHRQIDRLPRPSSGPRPSPPTHRRHGEGAGERSAGSPDRQAQRAAVRMGARVAAGAAVLGHGEGSRHVGPSPSCSAGGIKASGRRRPVPVHQRHLPQPGAEAGMPTSHQGIIRSRPTSCAASTSA